MKFLRKKFSTLLLAKLLLISAVVSTQQIYAGTVATLKAIESKIVLNGSLNLNQLNLAIAAIKKSSNVPDQNAYLTLLEKIYNFSKTHNLSKAELDAIKEAFNFVSFKNESTFKYAEQPFAQPFFRRGAEFQQKLTEIQNKINEKSTKEVKNNSSSSGSSPSRSSVNPSPKNNFSSSSSSSKIKSKHIAAKADAQKRLAEQKKVQEDARKKLEQERKDAELARQLQQAENDRAAQARQKAAKDLADKQAEQKRLADEAEQKRIAKEKADKEAKDLADKLAKEKADKDAAEKLAEQKRLADDEAAKKAQEAKAFAEKLAKEEAQRIAEQKRIAKEKADKELADKQAEQKRLADEAKQRLAEAQQQQQQQPAPQQNNHMSLMAPAGGTAAAILTTATVAAALISNSNSNPSSSTVNTNQDAQAQEAKKKEDEQKRLQALEEKRKQLAEDRKIAEDAARKAKENQPSYTPNTSSSSSSSSTVNESDDDQFHDALDDEDFGNIPNNLPRTTVQPGMLGGLKNWATNKIKTEVNTFKSHPFRYLTLTALEGFFAYLLTVYATQGQDAASQIFFSTIDLPVNVAKYLWNYFCSFFVPRANTNDTLHLHTNNTAECPNPNFPTIENTVTAPTTVTSSVDVPATFANSSDALNPSLTQATNPLTAANPIGQDTCQDNGVGGQFFQATPLGSRCKPNTISNALKSMCKFFGGCKKN